MPLINHYGDHAEDGILIIVIVVNSECDIGKRRVITDLFKSRLILASDYKVHSVRGAFKLKGKVCFLYLALV